MSASGLTDPRSRALLPTSALWRWRRDRARCDRPDQPVTEQHDLRCIGGRGPASAGSTMSNGTTNRPPAPSASTKPVAERDTKSLDRCLDCHEALIETEAAPLSSDTGSPAAVSQSCQSSRDTVACSSVWCARSWGVRNGGPRSCGTESPPL